MASSRVAVLPAAEEEQIIKMRSWTQTTVVRGDPPFKRLAKKFIQLVEEADKDSPDALERAYQAFLREVALMDVQANKYDTMLLANEREQQRHALRQEELAAQIGQVEADIAAAKVELRHAETVRQQHEEYEVLRHMLVQHPSRASTQKEIDRVQAAIEKTQLEGQKATAVMQRRRQQFALLIHVIDELHRALDDPNDAAADAHDAAPTAGAGPVAAGTEAATMDVD